MTPRAANTLMAIAILLLLGWTAWQQMRISGLVADVEQARRELTTRLERMAQDKVQQQRAELVGAVSFVDDLYRSPEGLQRPSGLYNLDTQKIDAEAIGTWVLDVYMKARIEGKSDADARQAISDAIKGSDEWRNKHRGSGK